MLLRPSGVGAGSTRANMVVEYRDRAPSLEATSNAMPSIDFRLVGNGGANPATGYGLFEAADLDDALAKARGCPILEAGGSVELAECIDM